MLARPGCLLLAYAPSPRVREVRGDNWDDLEKSPMRRLIDWADERDRELEKTGGPEKLRQFLDNGRAVALAGVAIFVLAMFMDWAAESGDSGAGGIALMLEVFLVVAWAIRRVSVSLSRKPRR